jgi:hypothetical protein
VTRAQVDAWADEHEVELLCADGFDTAILGIGQRFNDYFVVYDMAKVIEQLVRDGMTVDEAEEWFGFNIVGAWVGDATPCFLMTDIP